MILVIDGRGAATCLYDEAIDLARLGPLDLRRASHVEPDVLGRWWTDLHPAGGPMLGPFALRSEALTAERVWLEERLSSQVGEPILSLNSCEKKGVDMLAFWPVVFVIAIFATLARFVGC
jgi:hypothetical protein